jgi:hypothetical protein
MDVSKIRAGCGKACRRGNTPTSKIADRIEFVEIDLCRILIESYLNQARQNLSLADSYPRFALT